MRVFSGFVVAVLSIIMLALIGAFVFLLVAKLQPDWILGAKLLNPTELSNAVPAANYSVRTGFVELLLLIGSAILVVAGLVLAAIRTNEMRRSNDNARDSIAATRDTLQLNEKVFENSQETKYLELYKAGAELVAGDKIDARIAGIQTWGRLVHQTKGQYAESVALQLLRIAAEKAYDQQTRFAAFMELGYIRFQYENCMNEDRFYLASKSTKINNLHFGASVISKVDWSGLRLTSNGGQMLHVEQSKLLGLNWFDPNIGSVNFFGCDISHSTFTMEAATVFGLQECSAREATMRVARDTKLDTTRSDLTGARGFSDGVVCDANAIKCWYETTKPHINIVGDRQTKLFKAVEGETQYQTTIPLGLKIYLPPDD